MPVDLLCMTIPARMSGWGFALTLCIAILLAIAKGAPAELPSLEQLLTSMGEATREYSKSAQAAAAVGLDQAQRGEITEDLWHLAAEACKLTEQIELRLWHHYLLAADLNEVQLDEAEAAVKAFLDLHRAPLVKTSVFKYVLLNENIYHLQQFPMRIAFLRGRKNPTTLSREYAEILLKGQIAASSLMRLLEQIGFSTAELWCPKYGQEMDPEDYQEEEILARQVDLQARLADCFHQYMECARSVVNDYNYEKVKGNGVFITAQDIVLRPWSHFRYLVGHPTMVTFLLSRRNTAHHHALLERLELAIHIGDKAFNEVRRLAGSLLNKVPLCARDKISYYTEPLVVMARGWFLGCCSAESSDVLANSAFAKPSRNLETMIPFDYHLRGIEPGWAPSGCDSHDWILRAAIIQYKGGGGTKAQRTLNEHYSYESLRTGFLRYRDQCRSQGESECTKSVYQGLIKEVKKYKILVAQVKALVRKQESSSEVTPEKQEEIRLQMARLACAAASFLHIVVLHDLKELDTSQINYPWNHFLDRFDDFCRFATGTPKTTGITTTCECCGLSYSAYDALYPQLVGCQEEERQLLQ